VPTLRVANLALKFILELGAFAAFAYWGATTGGGALSFVLAIVAPGAALTSWGLLAAPKSQRRLPATARVPFELFVFGLAVVVLIAAGDTIGAVVFGIVVVVNAALLTVFHQWDQ
jgi:hypothetical protein